MVFNLNSEKLVQEGIFFVYIDADEQREVKYSEVNYSKKEILPKINSKEIDRILFSNTSIKFLGITADQQLYKPRKDANIFVSALNYPNSLVKLAIRKNGAIWFEDSVELSSSGGIM